MVPFAMLFLYMSAGRVSSRTYFFLGVLVGDMAQIGRSSSRRPQLVGWLVGLDEESIFGTEKTPGGRAQVLVASLDPQYSS